MIVLLPNGVLSNDPSVRYVCLERDYVENWITATESTHSLGDITITYVIGNDAYVAKADSYSNPDADGVWRPRWKSPPELVRAGTTYRDGVLVELNGHPLS